jgi:hypothetical protein
MVARRISRASAAGAALVVTLAASPRGQEPADLDVLLDRLVTYLAGYETALNTVVADERYEQHEVRTGLRTLRHTRRTLESEVTFLRLPGNAEWFGVRDVRKVDGKAVKRTGITLSELLKNPGVDFVTRAAAIVEASSRHNLGGTRSINMPTVPLEALSAHHHPRFIFRVRGKARIEGVQTQRLDFEEFDEPTLVHHLDGTSAWSRGSAWIEPDTGRLWRAELVVGPDAPGRARRTSLESRLRVDFTHNAALDLLVPKELTEEFWVPGGRGTGRARYSNYRQFTTAARIIP